MLQYPEAMGAEQLGKGEQRQWRQAWVTYLARVLSKRGVAIKQPSQWGKAEESIGAAFKKPIEPRLRRSLVQYGITTIKKALQLGDNGEVQVSATGLNTRWKRLLRMELRRTQEKEKTVEESYLSFTAIREALRGPVGLGSVHRFAAEMVRAKWGSREHWRAVHNADRIVAYTDGSVKQKRTTASMGFGGVIISKRQGEEVGRIEFSGATRDGPFSLMVAELLAIAVAVALIPRGKDIHVKMDSRAAVASIKALAGSQAGDAGNKWADRLADNGYTDQDSQWSLQLGPPPKPYPQYWLCVNNNPTPRSAGRTCREQEEGWAAKQFIEQVKSAHKEVEFEEKEIEVVLKVANGAVDKEGRVIYKNSWRVTSEHDTRVRSFTIKTLLGYLPVMKHEVAWYPLVYPEPELA
ncbi:hypothetical protein EV182_002238, partial [Spiromyces aspiralis]